MKLKSPKLTPTQWEHLKAHGWADTAPAFKPADSPRAAVGRRNGRKATKNKIVREKFGGR